MLSEVSSARKVGRRGKARLGRQGSRMTLRGVPIEAKSGLLSEALLRMLRTSLAAS